MSAIFKANNAIVGKFKHPFSFELPIKSKTAVYGPYRSHLIDIISGRIMDPQKRITYPSFEKSLWPMQAVDVIRFGEGNSSSSKAPFIGARYESFRDEFDYTLEEVMQAARPKSFTDSQFKQIVDSFNLNQLMDRWSVGLSNGQSRRAQIAMALMKKPKLLIIDEPFLGLDKENTTLLSDVLETIQIPLIIGLRIGEDAPHWVNHYLFADKDGVVFDDEALKMIDSHKCEISQFRQDKLKVQHRMDIRDKNPVARPSIEFRGLQVKFADSDTYIFKNLEFKIADGERVRIQGPNGSGKSTLFALITADHPKSWSEKVVLFGEPRVVGKHSYFGINEDIGVSSPEIHAIFPKRLNIFQAISTGFASSLFPIKKTSLSSHQIDQMKSICDDLGLDLNDPTPFRDLSMPDQKMILFARAIVKSPRILILDEAFSTVPIAQMQLAFAVLEKYQGTVLIVAHLDDEAPPYNRSINLHELNEPNTK